MADVKETLVKEAIRKAEEEAAKKAEEEIAAETDAETEGKAEEKAGTEESGETDESGAAETADEETNAEEAGDGQETKKKKPGIFNKKNKKDPRDEKIEELNDKLLRNLAEFENFRKRSEKEKSQMFEVGAKSIIEKILPAIDSFERGLSGLSEEDKANPVAEGMEKIYRQLIGSLKDAGLEPIEAVGAEFDPNFHNAVMHEDNEELGENVVSEELQKGYMYRGSVVRHSMVKVAN